MIQLNYSQDVVIFPSDNTILSGGEVAQKSVSAISTLLTLVLLPLKFLA